MGTSLKELSPVIEKLLGADLVSSEYKYDELTVQVYTGAIVRILTLLRNHEKCQFSQLVDLCGSDYPERPQRFEVVYHLLSVPLNLRLRIKVQTDAVTPVPTVIGVFPNANWYEREAWDLFGIVFADHPDLRRIMTDYNFDGHALRKDFPLTGYVEPRYSEEKKRVVYNPVQLPQEYRSFDYLSPWEGLGADLYRDGDGPLPGDEKAKAQEDAA